MRYLFFCLFLASCTQAADQIPSQFIQELESLHLEQRQARIGSFWASSPALPLTESDSLAVFLFRSDSSQVSVVGDFSDWKPETFEMTRVEGTDLWYREVMFEPDARLDYQFVVNETMYSMDPMNSFHVSGGYGSNSELAMPRYVQPEEINISADVSKGSLTEHTITSQHLNGSRKVFVYAPPGYDAVAEVALGIMLFHDGSDYLNLGSMPAILDNLIASGQIQPIFALFLDPADRMEEYAGSHNRAFVNFVVEEFMPWANSEFHISSDPARRGVTGISLGGNISAQLCNEHPDVFGLCAPLSTAFGVDRGALLSRIADSDESTVKYYVEWGTYEPSISRYSSEYLGALRNNGNEHLWNEWHEGHSWGMWRAHQDIMLEYFFPGPNATSF